MPNLKITNGPDLSGLNNAEIKELVTLGMREFARRQDAAAAAVSDLAGESCVEPLTQLALMHEMDLAGYVGSVLQQHVRDWRRYLVAAGHPAPGVD